MDEVSSNDLVDIYIAVSNGQSRGQAWASNTFEIEGTHVPSLWSLGLSQGTWEVPADSETVSESDRKGP